MDLLEQLEAENFGLQAGNDWLREQLDDAERTMDQALNRVRELEQQIATLAEQWDAEREEMNEQLLRLGEAAVEAFGGAFLDEAAAAHIAVIREAVTVLRERKSSGPPNRSTRHCDDNARDRCSCCRKCGPTVPCPEAVGGDDCAGRCFCGFPDRSKEDGHG